MSILDQLVNFFTELIGSLGYMGVTIVVGAEYACVPMPSEVVLPFIGLTASQGEFSYIGALVASILGGLIGSLICYAIGYFGGVPFLNWTQVKFPKTEKSISALNRWFKKYGKPAVLIARMIPLTRTYVSFLAGVEKMKVSVFVFYSSLGIIIWNIVLISLGYYVGDNLDLIEKIMGKYSMVVMIIFAIAAIGYVAYKLNKKKKIANQN